MPTPTRSAREHEDLTRGPIARKLLMLAAPMAAGNLASTVLSLIDTFFLSRLGASALAGVGIGTTLLYVIWTILPAIAMGAMAIGSRSAGAGDDEELGRVTGQALVLGVVLWVALAALGIFGGRWMVTLLAGTNAAEATIVAGTTYTRVIFAGCIFTITYFCCASMLRGSGNAVAPMISNSLACVINLILDPILIFGWGPIPAFGVAGAVSATVFANACNAAYLLYLCGSGRLRVHLFLRHLRPRFDLMARILRLAIPNTVQYGLETSVMLLMMRIVAGHGDLVIAAYTIGFRMDLMVFLPGWAISQAGASFVGQNLGARELQRARSGAWTAFRMLALVQVSIGVLYFLFGPQIVGVFASGAEAAATLQAIGVSYLRLVPLSYVFLSLGMCMASALTGAGDTVAAMSNVVFSRIAIQLPAALFLPRLVAAYTDLPEYYGLWIGIMLGNLLHGVLNAGRFHRGVWQGKTV